ncbi:unnamed protein product, partial [Meganyctiphanes norvegica]
MPSNRLQKLGLVQKKKLSVPTKKRGEAVKQEFDYIFVLDFESTCWESGPRVGQEIIEFPTVLLDMSSGKVVSEFQQYVMPVEQPILSEFCTKLTGITQNQVEDGMPIGACLGMFTRWVTALSKKHQFSFNTNLPGKHATFATWSDWDLSVCLHYECLRKQLKKPEFFNQWIDIRLTYRNFFNRKPKGLAGALREVGISFEGREHSGIDDAKNTAALVTCMAKNGCLFKITKTLDTKPKDVPSKTSNYRIFRGIRRYWRNKTRSLDGSRHKNGVLYPKNTGQALKQKQGNTVQNQRIIKATVDKQNKSSTSIIDTGKISRAKNNISDGIAGSSINKNLKKQDQLSADTLQKCEHQINLNSFTEKISKDCIESNKKRSSKSNSFESINIGNTFQSPSNSIMYKTNTLLKKTNSVSSTSDKKSLNNITTYLNEMSSNSTNIHSNASNNISKTTSTTLKEINKTVNKAPMFKKTPPLCNCGRRSRLLNVSKPGPNEGRYFYCCPKGSRDKNGCGFFKWEDQPYSRPSVSSVSMMQRFVTPAHRPLRKAISLPNNHCKGNNTFNHKPNGASLPRYNRNFCKCTKYKENRINNSKRESLDGKIDESLIITPFIVRQQN